MEMLRVLLNWTGFTGAPGISAFYFAGGGGLISDAQQVADRVGNAALNLNTALPAGVILTVDQEVQRIDSDTGAVLDFHAVTPPSRVEGIGPGPYSAASGAVVNWNTQDVRFNRRIRGRTFLVPLSNSSYEGNGTLSSAAIGDLNDFANSMRGGDLDSELVVWSRPRAGSGGVAATVTGHTIPDMAAVLRSRRD